jgi:hypothetical protein
MMCVCVCVCVTLIKAAEDRNTQGGVNVWSGGESARGGGRGEDSTAALACFLGLAGIMSFSSLVSDTLMPSKFDINFLGKK